MASNYHKFWAHTFMYNAPLSWRHVLLLYGGFSQINPDISNFKSHGHSTQASLRYQMPLVPFYNRFIHEPSLGFDFKNLNSNLFFAEPNAFVPVVAHEVNITQFYGGYTIGRNWEKNMITFRLEAFWAPCAMIGNQDNSNFSDLHPGAKNRYFYSRLLLADTWTLPYNFMLMGQFRGQVSTQNLVPSEQFGLGGYDTVRGYEEREWNFDDAICINLEGYFPSFSLHPKKRLKDEFKFLVFFDYATGRNVHNEGEPQWQHLMGVGPGLRYKITDYFSARLDWGFRLDKTVFSGYGSKLHFGLMGSY
jgi:hemolysin activation/secretion protein